MRLVSGFKINDCLWFSFCDTTQLMDDNISVSPRAMTQRCLSLLKQYIDIRRIFAVLFMCTLYSIGVYKPVEMSLPPVLWFSGTVRELETEVCQSQYQPSSRVFHQVRTEITCCYLYRHNKSLNMVYLAYMDNIGYISRNICMEYEDNMYERLLTSQCIWSNKTMKTCSVKMSSYFVDCTTV